MSTELATTEKTTIAATKSGLQLTTFEDMWRFASAAVASGLVKMSESQALVALEYGAEIGLAPMQALTNIAVINGKPCLWGDSLKALVEASPHCEYIKETFNDEGDIATCEAKRKGRPEPHVVHFSMLDAEQAGLTGKGPWKQYSRRMLQMRARSWCLRDQFADLLCGLQVAEEVRDYQEDEIQDGETIEASSDTADNILRESE